MEKKLPVAVLAATGSVGQRFIQLLDNHPWFEVVALTASDRSAGQTYAEACHWILPDPMPSWAGAMKIRPTDPRAVDAPIVFLPCRPIMRVMSNPSLPRRVQLYFPMQLLTAVNRMCPS